MVVFVKDVYRKKMICTGTEIDKVLYCQQCKKKKSKHSPDVAAVDDWTDVHVSTVPQSSEWTNLSKGI